MYLHVTIGIACTDMITADFGLSLASLIADFHDPIPGWEGQEIRVHKQEGSLLQNQREDIMRTAIEKGCSHLLFLDSDQYFPSNALRRLLAWHKPVVACNIPVKRFPSCPTARAVDEKDTKGRVIYTFAWSKGLERAWRVGTGIMLIDLSVIKPIPEPWFPTVWKPDLKQFQGEDWGFCTILEQHKIKIYIDHGLSWEIGHVGKLRYTHDLVESPIKPASAERTVLMGEVPPDLPFKRADMRGISDQIEAEACQ